MREPPSAAALEHEHRKSQTSYSSRGLGTRPVDQARRRMGHSIGSTAVKIGYGRSCEVTPVCRRAFVLSTAMAALSWPCNMAWPSTQVVVEDWTGVPAGTVGVPHGWKQYETPGGHPTYDFIRMDEGGRPALALRSAWEHSTIAKELHVHLGSTP